MRTLFLWAALASIRGGCFSCANLSKAENESQHSDTDPAAIEGRMDTIALSLACPVGPYPSHQSSDTKTGESPRNFTYAARD
ncbi:MAG: hypothetical protein C4325_09655 [Blastocatellia bacterium]